MTSHSNDSIRKSPDQRTQDGEVAPASPSSSFETSNDNPVPSSWLPSERLSNSAFEKSKEGLAEDMGWDFGFGRETLPYTHSDYGRDDMRTGSSSFGFGSQNSGSTASNAPRDEHSYDPKTSWNAASSVEASDVRSDYSGVASTAEGPSDETLMNDVEDALQAASDIDASHIEVQVAHGVVTLTGSVAERSHKRLAEDTAEHVAGVKDVRNELAIDVGLFERAKEMISNVFNPET